MRYLRRKFFIKFLFLKKANKNVINKYKIVNLKLVKYAQIVTKDSF